MKKTRLLAFLALCCLLLAAVPLSGAAEEAPKLYFDLNFDDLPVGAVSKDNRNWMLRPDGTRHNTFLSVRETVSAIGSRWGNNHCLTHSKKKGDTAVTDVALLWQNGPKITSLAAAETDFVIQWDMFVDRDDGGAVYLFAPRSLKNAWSNTNQVRINQMQEDGTAPMTYKNASGQYVSTELRFTYGKWSRIAVVLHHEAATMDLYLDGVLAFSGAPIPADSEQVTLGKFMTANKGAPADCTLSMDNIRVYSGSKPHTDAELGIVPSGSVLAGVQFSAVKAEKYGMRLVGTVDGLNYASVGTDLSFSWKENGETKTKTASKTASAVYDSILATADGAIEAYTAENLGGKYLWALTIDGIPTAAGEVTVDVDCWSMTDGVKTVQCRMRLVVKDGKLLSSCVL